MRTVKKTQKTFIANNSFVFILKEKTNKWNQFLTLFIFRANFNNICPKKWFTAFCTYRLQEALELRRLQLDNIGPANSTSFFI
jgi:hypothetical protein